jgi:hypothetical protein
MTDVPDSFAHYLAAWNEPDTTSIRAHLDRAVTADVLFVDPAHTTVDIDELEAMIHEARLGMPTADYRVVSEIDGHNRRYRYRWEVWVGDELLMPGMDVTTVDDEDRIIRVDG